MTRFRDRFPRNPSRGPVAEPIRLDPQTIELIDGLSERSGIPREALIDLLLAYALGQLTALASMQPLITLLARVQIAAAGHLDQPPGEGEEGEAEGEKPPPPEAPEKGEDPVVFRERMKREAAGEAEPKP